MNWNDVAKIGFEACGDRKWEEVGREVQAGWIAAAKAIVGALIAAIEPEPQMIEKVESLGGDYYYITGISNPGPTGWLKALTITPDTASKLTWLPFSYWEVKAKWERTIPTQDEIDAYVAYNKEHAGPFK